MGRFRERNTEFNYGRIRMWFYVGAVFALFLVIGVIKQLLRVLF